MQQQRNRGSREQRQRGRDRRGRTEEERREERRAQDSNFDTFDNAAGERGEWGIRSVGQLQSRETRNVTDNRRRRRQSERERREDERGRSFSFNRVQETEEGYRLQNDVRRRQRAGSARPLRPREASTDTNEARLRDLEAWEMRKYKEFVERRHLDETDQARVLRAVRRAEILYNNLRHYVAESREEDHGTRRALETMLEDAYFAARQFDIHSMPANTVRRRLAFTDWADAQAMDLNRNLSLMGLAQLHIRIMEVLDFVVSLGESAPAREVQRGANSVRYRANARQGRGGIRTEDLSQEIPETLRPSVLDAWRAAGGEQIPAMPGLRQGGERGAEGQSLQIRCPNQDSTRYTREFGAPAFGDFPNFRWANCGCWIPGSCGRIVPPWLRSYRINLLYRLVPPDVQEISDRNTMLFFSCSQEARMSTEWSPVKEGAYNRFTELDRTRFMGFTGSSEYPAPMFDGPPSPTVQTTMPNWVDMSDLVRVHRRRVLDTVSRRINTAIGSRRRYMQRSEPTFLNRHGWADTMSASVSQAYRQLQVEENDERNEKDLRLFIERNRANNAEREEANNAARESMRRSVRADLAAAGGQGETATPTLDESCLPQPVPLLQNSGVVSRTGAEEYRRNQEIRHIRRILEASSSEDEPEQIYSRIVRHEGDRAEARRAGQGSSGTQPGGRRDQYDQEAARTSNGETSSRTVTAVSTSSPPRPLTTGRTAEGGARGPTPACTATAHTGSDTVSSTTSRSVHMCHTTSCGAPARPPLTPRGTHVNPLSLVLASTRPAVNPPSTSSEESASVQARNPGDILLRANHDETTRAMRADEARDSADMSISLRSSIADEEDLYADIGPEDEEGGTRDLSAVGIDELGISEAEEEDERAQPPLVPLEELGVVAFLRNNSDLPRLDTMEAWDDRTIHDVTRMFGRTQIFHQNTTRDPHTNAISVEHRSGIYHIEWNTSEGIRRGATSQPRRERVFMHGLWVFGTFYERYSRDPVENGSQQVRQDFTGNRTRRLTSSDLRSQQVFAVDHLQPDDGSIMDEPPPGVGRSLNSRVTHTLLTLLAIERSRMEESSRSRARGDTVIPILGINQPWIDPIPSAPTEERTECIFCMDAMDRIDRQTENVITVRTENIPDLYIGQFHPCGHIFHYVCAHKFIATYTFPVPVPCPLCRTAITKLRAHPTYTDYPFRHERNIFRVTEDSDTFRTHPNARLPALPATEQESAGTESTLDEAAAGPEVAEPNPNAEKEEKEEEVQENRAESQGARPRERIRAPERPATPTTPPPRTPDRTALDRETVTEIVDRIEQNMEDETEEQPCLPYCTRLVCLPSCQNFWKKMQRMEAHTTAGTLGTLNTNEDDLHMLYAAQFARDRAADQRCTDFCYEAVCLPSCNNFEHRRALVHRLHSVGQLGLVGLTLPSIVKQRAIAETIQQSINARDQRLGRIRPDGTRAVPMRSTNAVLPEDRYQSNRAAADLAEALQNRDVESDVPDWGTVAGAMEELSRDLNINLQPIQPRTETEAQNEGEPNTAQYVWARVPREDSQADQGGSGQDN